MSFDKNDLNKILSLSPEEFDKKLTSALNSSGIDGKVAKMVMKDTSKIRNALSGLSEKDLQGITEVMKKNNLGQLENIIKKEIEERG